MTTTAHQPLETVGLVRILTPCSKGYYRLKWSEPDGTRGDTSAGRTLESARAKATTIDDRLQLAVGPLATTTLRDMADRFVAEGRSPYPNRKTKRPELWKKSQRNNIRKALNRCLHRHEHLRAMDIDLDRKLVDEMRAQAGTYDVVRQNTSALRALLTWAGKRKYLSHRQAELLPRGALAPDPVFPRERRIIHRADSPARVCHAGDADGFVRDEDAPSALQVVALSNTMANRTDRWGALAPELAANSGMRWGEQFQLTADDVHVDGCAQDPSGHAHVAWQIDPGATAISARRCRPKGNTTRLVPIARTSFTGFPLREEVRARVAQARREQAEGRNPEALLFPAEGGGLLWHTAFTQDILLPAMQEAGWPIDVYEEYWHHWNGTDFVRRTTVRREARLTWHSLRHRFARICVDVKGMREGALMALGGWQNIATVQNRYYRSGDQATKEGTAAFEG